MDREEKIVFGSLSIICILMVACVVLLLADVIAVTHVSDTGVVRGKEYEPATTRVQAAVDANGKPTTRVIPVAEKFILLLQTEKSGHVTVEVDQSIYDTVEVSDPVRYDYNRGKLGGTRSNEKVKPLD